MLKDMGCVSNPEPRVVSEGTRPVSLGLGVIEGFFGPRWRWAEHAACARFLAWQGFALYFFVPERCDALPWRWSEPWLPEEWRRLARGIARLLRPCPLILYP